MGTYLLVLLLLACPLLMWVMMRGGHGHGGHDHGHGPASIDDLRRRRDELDREIAVRERPREGGSDAAVTET
ncbi:MAG: DUF2933 domain-containing protein [Gaiellaceae bacterium]